MLGHTYTAGDDPDVAAHSAADIALDLLARLPSDVGGAEVLVETLARAFGWDAGRLWEAGGGGDQPAHTASWCADPSLEAALDPGAGEEELARRVLSIAAPEWIVGESETGWQTVLAFPIGAIRRHVGVVELLDRRLRAPEDDVIRRVSALAEPLGGWLENRRRHAERHRLLGRLSTAERRQRFLAEVSAALAGTLDEKRMLEELCRIAASRFSDWCSAHLVGDDGSIRLVALETGGPARNEATHMMDRPPGLWDEEGVGRVLRTGMPVLYPTVPDALVRAVAHDDDHLEALRRLRLASVMVVPMPGRGRTLGAIAFASMEPDRIYTPDDLALAEDVGRRAGLAMAGAQLYRRERATAATLQEGLLPPRLPNVPGMELVGRYRPGEEGLLVGGDFYEGFQIDESTWVLGIGDVCGHGPAAAALTARVRHSARALATRCAGPAELLVEVNRLLRQDGNEIPFCTAIYGWLRTGESGSRLTLARAGHPLPMVRRGDRVDEVVSKGSVLGLFDAIELEEVTVELEPGDVVLFYTDGVSEARRKGSMLGTAKVAEILADVGASGSEPVADAIERSVLDFSGGRLRDDIALLILRAEST